MSVCVCMCVYIYVCVYICVCTHCVCVCVHVCVSGFRYPVTVFTHFGKLCPFSCREESDSYMKVIFFHFDYYLTKCLLFSSSFFCSYCGIEQKGHLSLAFSRSVHYFCLSCGRETQGGYGQASTWSASAARWTGSRICPTAQCSMTKPADCPLVKGENCMTNSQRQWYR